jgi:hypothetical protein
VEAAPIPWGAAIQNNNAGVEMSDVQRFLTAVKVMAGNGHVKQRLIQAYEENLQDIACDDLPVAARQAYSDLRAMMQTVAPLNGEGPIRATVRKMSVHDADRCARLMVDLLAEIVRHSDSGQERLPLHPEERTIVPPFLVKSG